MSIWPFISSLPLLLKKKKSGLDPESKLLIFVNMCFHGLSCVTYFWGCSHLYLSPNGPPPAEELIQHENFAMWTGDMRPTYWFELEESALSRGGILLHCYRKGHKVIFFFFFLINLHMCLWLLRYRNYPGSRWRHKKATTLFRSWNTGNINEFCFVLSWGEGINGEEELSVSSCVILKNNDIVFNQFKVTFCLFPCCCLTVSRLKHFSWIVSSRGLTFTAFCACWLDFCDALLQHMATDD